MIGCPLERGWEISEAEQKATVFRIYIQGVEGTPVTSKPTVAVC